MYIHAIHFWVPYTVYYVQYNTHVSCWTGEWLYSSLWGCFTEYEEGYLFTQAFMLCKHHCSVWFIVQCYYAWAVPHCFLQQAPVYKKEVGGGGSRHVQYTVPMKINETIERI